MNVEEDFRGNTSEVSYCNFCHPVLFVNISKKRIKKTLLFFLLFGQTRSCHILMELKKKGKQKKTAKKRVKKQEKRCCWDRFWQRQKKWFVAKRCRFAIEEKLGCVAFGYVFDRRCGETMLNHYQENLVKREF